MSETIRQLELEKAKGRIRHYGYCNFGVQNMADGEAAGGKPISNQASQAVPATRARFSMRHELWLAVKRMVLCKCSSSVSCTVAVQSSVASSGTRDLTQSSSVGPVRASLLAAAAGPADGQIRLRGPGAGRTAPDPSL